MRALSLLVCLSIILQGAPALADFESRANAPEARRVDPAPSSRLSHAWPPLGSIYQVAQLEGDGTSATDLDRRIAELEARGLPFAVVEGVGEDRLKSAISAIDDHIDPGFFLPFKPVWTQRP